MHPNTNSFININQIIYSWLIKNGKTLHAYYKVLPLAAEAIRELSFTHMPLVKPVLLHKKREETWFKLPEDYTSWVKIGVRDGETWRPLPIHEGIMPMPNEIHDSGSFADDLDINDKQWTNWVNPEGVKIPASFNPGDFSPDSFLTHDSSKQGDGGRSICYDEIAWVNESKGVIVVPYNFPYDELYLLYNSTGGADSMTNIPVIAQAAIEAYISWKYAMNKRGGLTEGRIFKAEYIEQVELLRARLLELTAEDVRFLFDINYGRPKII